MILRQLRDDIDETRRDLTAHAENVAESVDAAAFAITLVGLAAVVALVLAGYAVTASGAKPPW